MSSVTTFNVEEGITWIEIFLFIVMTAAPSDCYDKGLKAWIFVLLKKA